MRWNVWLIMAVSCVSFAVIQSVCPRGQPDIRTCDAAAPLLFNSIRLVSRRQFAAGLVTSWPQLSFTDSRVIDPRGRSLSRLADLPSDDEGSVEDSRSDGKDMQFGCLNLWLKAADWRLNRPDTHRANSFINSKSKPPPRKES